MGVSKFFSVEYQGGVNFRGIEFMSWVRNMIADLIRPIAQEYTIRTACSLIPQSTTPNQSLFERIPQVSNPFQLGLHANWYC
jgi:hypothetical protein